MATTNDLKNGMVLNLDGQLWSVVWFQHHKPGKGGAVVRTKLKSVLSGKVVDRTFNADLKVDDRAGRQARHAVPLPRRQRLTCSWTSTTYDQMTRPRRGRRRREGLPARQRRGDGRRQRRAAALHRAAGVGRAHRRVHRAGPAGRPLQRRHQAGPPGDRQGDPGAAVHHLRREDQGRHPRRQLSRPRVRPDVCPHQVPQARARHPLRVRAPGPHARRLAGRAS